MSHKMLLFKAGIDFSSPADSCYIICVLEMCWSLGVSFPHTQHMTTTFLKSSIPSHGMDVFKNQFHNRIDFSQGIDSIESMPWILKRLKIRALRGRHNTPSSNTQLVLVQMCNDDISIFIVLIPLFFSVTKKGVHVFSVNKETAKITPN